LSERNKTQGFFNAFRDLKGFNYRDYGREFGPIISYRIKIYLSIHPTGVLAIGVDDRTLVAEGSDVFVNTAQALSPTSKTISDLFGASHPEAIVRTDTTIAGGLQLSAVGFKKGQANGDKMNFVKTVLEI
jgi:hypothetical protein